MKNFLAITSLDYQTEPNQRIHHVVKYFRPFFEEVVVLYKANFIAKSLWHEFRHLFHFEANLSQQQNVTYIRVDPLLNNTIELSLRATGYPNLEQTGRLKWKLRKLISRAIAFVNMPNKELLHFFWMAFFYLLNVRGKFDVCLAQGPRGAAVGYLLKKMGRVKMLVYEDDDHYGGELKTIRERYIAWLEKFLLRKADLIISAGMMLGELRRKQTQKDVVVLCNGVNYGMFEPAQQKIEHPPTLVYMGNVAYWSGMDLAIKAIPEIKKEIPNIRLLIIGSGFVEYENGLKKLVKDLQLEDNVVFTGRKPYEELPLYLKGADIGLATFRKILFRKFAFPLKVIEYMAAGLPVIGTKDTETENIITQYECGKAIGFDKRAFAECVCSLLKDKEKYERYRRNAIKYSRGFDWSQVMREEYECIQNAFLSRFLGKY